MKIRNKEIKCLLEFPFLSRYNRNRKIDRIPIGAGIHFSWSDYEFNIGSDDGYYPKQRHEGKHIFTIWIGIFYWSGRVTWYIKKKV